MKYFSTFSGIGGFELGIQLAYDNRPNIRHRSEVLSKDLSNTQEPQGGPTCIGYSEIDKYASQIYQSHFPNHKNYGDITSIIAEDLPDFDLLVGGFPCQSFSIAGKRGGFNDTRGTMFFELARILRAKQPRLFVFENVKGLLSHDGGRTFATIIQTLDELGYDCQWQVLNSKNHGVPQNRERVFIVGHSRGTSRPEVFPFGCSDETIGGNRSIPKVIARGGLQNNAGEMMERSPALTEAMGKGGGQTPIVAKIPEATKQGYAVAHEGDSINLSVPKSKTRRGRVGHGVAQTLDTGMQQHTLQNSQIRRLTPTECERLQGFPDGWTEGVSDTQRYKTLGNAVTVNVIEDIFTKILSGDN